MHLKDRIEELKSLSFPAGVRVLSLYLNTEANGNPQAWKIHLKTGLKRMREYAEAQGSNAMPDQLDKLLVRVQKAVEDNRSRLRNGIIIFASTDESLWFFECVQAPVPNAFYWSRQLQLDDLSQVLERYPSMGIIQVSSGHISVLDTYLGGLEREWHYEWDMESEDWKEKKGLSYSIREASAATHKEQFDKRVAANLQRWLKRLSPILERHHIRNKWSGTVLTGEVSLANDLSSKLNINNTRILSKNLNGKPSHQVVQTIHSALHS